VTPTPEQRGSAADGVRRSALGARRSAFGETGYSVAAAISRHMVHLMSRYTGRGPTKARTTLNTNFAMVLLDDTLTRAERNLVAAGEIDSILYQRRTFHRMMREEAIAAVEQETGRKVRAYLSDIAPEAAVAAHVFVFEPRPETGEAYYAEADTESQPQDGRDVS
jgi:uncharacterized protein YbcI